MQTPPLRRILSFIVIALLAVQLSNDGFWVRGEFFSHNTYTGERRLQFDGMFDVGDMEREGGSGRNRGNFRIRNYQLPMPNSRSTIDCYDTYVSYGSTCTLK